MVDDHIILIVGCEALSVHVGVSVVDLLPVTGRNQASGFAPNLVLIHNDIINCNFQSC